MRMRGDRKLTSIIGAAGAALALCAPGAAAQLYQGNAATIRPGEIDDGMFAASNAFAKGTEITVRNLESGVAVKVKVVARANGGLVLLLLAPTAANAIGINPGEIVRVDAQLTSVAVDAGAQAADPSTSADPDVNPAAGLPASLADYLASLPPLDVTTVATETDSDFDTGHAIDGTTAQEGVSDSSTTDQTDVDTPPMLTVGPDQPDTDALDPSTTLAIAEVGADQLLEPTGAAEASAAQTVDPVGEAGADNRPAAVAEPESPDDSTNLARIQELLGVDSTPDTPEEASDKLSVAELDSPVQLVEQRATEAGDSEGTPDIHASDTLSADTQAPDAAAPPLTLLGVDQAPALPHSHSPRLATASPEPIPPAREEAPDTEADLAPTTYTTVTTMAAPVTTTAPPRPTFDTDSLTTSPPPYPADDELVALMAVPEPSSEAVARAEPTAELPIAVTRVVLVEPTKPRPPVATAEGPPTRITGEALAVVPATPTAPDRDDPALAEPTAGETTLEATADVDRTPIDDAIAPQDTPPAQDPTTDSAPSSLAGHGALGPPPSVDGPVYLLQLGAFASQNGAQNVAMRVPRSFAPAVVGSDGERPIFKVMIGPLNRDESGTLLYRFRASGFPDAFLIPVPAEELAQAHTLR